MALSNSLQDQVERLLMPRESGRAVAVGVGKTLSQEARRLWDRLCSLLTRHLLPLPVDEVALELACWALQLPARATGLPPIGRMGQVNLRERAEQAAELLLSLLGDQADEDLLERTARLLREVPVRSPTSGEARLLADALNLDDFGLTGLVRQAQQLARQGGEVEQVAEGWEKREQYGYWAMRLKEFHYEPVRQIARRRLEEAGRAGRALLAELEEDRIRRRDA